MTEEELASDRTIRILYPSSKLKNSHDPQSLHDRQEQTIILTSTCLDEDQMVCLKSMINIRIHRSYFLQNRVKDFCSKFDIQSSNLVDEHTTHLITDEEGETLVCPLSKKVIQAIARHMYIVTYRWIDACLKANRILDEKSFEIQGDLTLASDHHGLYLEENLLKNIFFSSFFKACNEVDKVFYLLIYRRIFY